MKKILIVILFSAGFICSVNAQKYAIIDTKYILGKMPEYVDADKKLQDISNQWQKEIDNLQAQLTAMYKNYDAEQYMLSDDLKKKREDELYNKEKQLRDLQKKRFGYEGDLFKERERIVKPIQDYVYNAVQIMAVARGYDFVLDKVKELLLYLPTPN